MPLPGAAQELFTTNNSIAACAAFSQTWLALSIIGNRPLTDPGIVQNQTMMKSIQTGTGVGRRASSPPTTPAGGPSQTTLAANGFTVGNQVVLQNATWAAIFQQVAARPAGYYCISMKNPGHANACYIAANGEIYYLEPEVGCYKYANAGTFTGNMPGWYQARTGQTTNTEFKIYAVS